MRPPCPPQLAKDRLKQLYPKFTGFSACRGESSMLPCLSGDCGDGVIDEVFMGTAQSCMELYRMKPALPPSSAAALNPGDPQQQGRPWQDLLVRGDQLLKELQAQDSWAGDGGGDGAKGKQDVIARTVVASAADMVDAISKLADVLGARGAGPGAGTGVAGAGKAVGGLQAPVGLGAGAGLSKVKPAKGTRTSTSAAAYAPPPPCDPIPDAPPPVGASEEEAASALAKASSSTAAAVAQAAGVLPQAAKVDEVVGEKAGSSKASKAGGKKKA